MLLLYNDIIEIEREVILDYFILLVIYLLFVRSVKNFFY